MVLWKARAGESPAVQLEAVRLRNGLSLPMTINSRDVSKLIKEEIRPLLEEKAFTKFTSRKAWRYLPAFVHEVNIQSLGSYNAQRLDTTPFSFSVYIGIAYLAATKYPWFDGLQDKDPPAYAYQARKTLRKNISQPKLLRPDIWYVDEIGQLIAAVIIDAKKAIIDQAIPWLARYSNEKIALKAFESKPDTEYEPGIGNDHFGGKVGSLGRARIASVLALELGDKRKAVRIWKKLLKNPYYRSLEDIREEADQNINWIIENC